MTEQVYSERDILRQRQAGASLEDLGALFPGLGYRAIASIIDAEEGPQGWSDNCDTEKP